MNNAHRIFICVALSLSFVAASAEASEYPEVDRSQEQRQSLRARLEAAKAARDAALARARMRPGLPHRQAVVEPQLAVRPAPSPAPLSPGEKG